MVARQAQLSLPVTPVEQAFASGSSSNLLRKRTVEDFTMVREIGHGSYSTVRPNVHASLLGGPP
jgi:hypothetical protein